jgi:hypothetical protein
MSYLQIFDFALSNDILFDSGGYACVGVIMCTVFDIYFLNYFYCEFCISLVMRGEYARFHWYTRGRYNSAAALAEWEKQFWPGLIHKDKLRQERRKEAETKKK